MPDSVPSSDEPSKVPLPLYAVMAAYDVSTPGPKRDVLILIRDQAASLAKDLEDVRNERDETRIALATSQANVQSLRQQLKSRMQSQMLTSLVGVLGTVLLGFGVNYLTANKPSPGGWVMLVLGGLLLLGSVAAPFIGRLLSDSNDLPQQINHH